MQSHMLYRKIEKLWLKITSYISRSCWHKALLLDHAPDVFLRGSPGTASTGIVLLSEKKTCIFKTGLMKHGPSLFIRLPVVLVMFSVSIYRLSRSCSGGIDD
ncbi:hypothetical protein GQ457_16G002710 [Hibiscus cannabinus]